MPARIRPNAAAPDAERAYRRALEREPTSRALLSLSLLEQAKGNNDSARALTQKAFDLQRLEPSPPLRDRPMFDEEPRPGPGSGQDCRRCVELGDRTCALECGSDWD